MTHNLTSSKNITIAKESTERSNEQKVRDFSDILNKIEGLDDKKKQLWREIYENAIIDRQNSYYMFTTLVALIENKSTEHAVHGKTVATYIERMSKANDQLIKLAELIAKADHSADPIDPDQIFDHLEKR